MPKRLRDRVQGRQGGFTLIELLVVILIIGILAAVAIPTFLSQKGKAQDANVQTNLNTLQIAEQTYNTSNSTWISANANIASLTNIEPTLKTFASTLTLGAAGVYSAADPNGAGPAVAYSGTITSASGVSYGLTAYVDGGIARTCTVPSTAPNAGACQVTSGSTGDGKWGS